MTPLTRLLPFLLLLLGPLRADPSLTHARHAQLLLGEEVWSRIILIENASRDGRYPRELHALVFEYAGLLWFYTGSEGTQSFSLHIGKVAAEKDDFLPLLRAIDPGFGRWRVVDGSGVAVNRGRPLPHGCWIDSVVALRERLAAGERLRQPRLLSYYMQTAAGLAGHTVLVYERAERLVVFDAARPRRSFDFSRERASNALALARLLEGQRVVKARELPLETAVQPSRTPAPVVALGVSVPAKETEAMQ